MENTFGTRRSCIDHLVKSTHFMDSERCHNLLKVTEQICCSVSTMFQASLLISTVSQIAGHGQRRGKEYSVVSWGILVIFLRKWSISRFPRCKYNHIYQIFQAVLRALRNAFADPLITIVIRTSILSTWLFVTMY